MISSEYISFKLMKISVTGLDITVTLAKNKATIFKHSGIQFVTNLVR